MVEIKAFPFLSHDIGADLCHCKWTTELDMLRKPYILIADIKVVAPKSRVVDAPVHCRGF